MLTAAFSCNNISDDKVTNDDNIASKKDSTQTVKANTIVAEANDSVIHISFPKDSTHTTVSAKMKGINRPVTVYIPVKQGKQLTVSIAPEDAVANVRINQIFTPDGKADGPFGKELKRAIKQRGTYKIIIGEDLMQGDEWKGRFLLTVTVM